MANNFQREGSISNAHVGKEFEITAEKVFATKGIVVSKNFEVEVGVSNKKKPHMFDLGADNPPVLVECKSHRWTSGDNVPSAKLTVWNEAMYYFACSPNNYRKILFVLHDKRVRNGETLAQYYVRTYAHLIPEDVEIWEYNEDRDEAETVEIK